MMQGRGVIATGNGVPPVDAGLAAPDAAVAACPLPVLGIVGPSGAGKTALLCRLLPELAVAGLRVGVIKQASARFDLDEPGRDSDRLRRAGLARTLVAAVGQTALIEERDPACQPGDCELADALGWLDVGALDLVLVEGFARAALPKLEVLRADGPKRHQYRHDAWVRVLLADHAPEPEPEPESEPAAAAAAASRLPRLDLADATAIAGWLCAYREEFLARRAGRTGGAARSGELAR